MKNEAGRLPLAGAAIFFAIFVANVLKGAFGGRAFFGDVVEMLMLLAAVILFVAGVLSREAASGTRPE